MYAVCTYKGGQMVVTLFQKVVLESQATESAGPGVRAVWGKVLR